jgi:hypothetical protein
MIAAGPGSEEAGGAVFQVGGLRQPGPEVQPGEDLQVREVTLLSTSYTVLENRIRCPGTCDIPAFLPAIFISYFTFRLVMEVVLRKYIFEFPPLLQFLYIHNLLHFTVSFHLMVLTFHLQFHMVIVKAGDQSPLIVNPLLSRVSKSAYC